MAVTTETYATPGFVAELKPAVPPEVKLGMWTGGGWRGPGVGWDEKALLNETTDRDGLIVPAHGFHALDKSRFTAAMQSRRKDDPAVQALRAHLAKHNGVKGLEICAPEEVERAARIYHRDGIVVVKDALGPEQLEVLRRGADG